MTTIAAGLKYYIFDVFRRRRRRKREKERERARENGEKKSPRKCECVRAHTTYTHRIDKKKREKGAVARSSILRDSFL
jgi:hypothetical protein